MAIAKERKELKEASEALQLLDCPRGGRNGTTRFAEAEEVFEIPMRAAETGPGSPKLVCYNTRRGRTPPEVEVELKWS